MAGGGGVRVRHVSDAPEPHRFLARHPVRQLLHPTRHREPAFDDGDDEDDDDNDDEDDDDNEEDDEDGGASFAVASPTEQPGQRLAVQHASQGVQPTTFTSQATSRATSLRAAGV
eukprot:1171353-Rhodomonas_salina.3